MKARLFLGLSVCCFLMSLGLLLGLALSNGVEAQDNGLRTDIGPNLAYHDVDWKVDWPDIYSIPPGNVGIGTANPDYKLHVEGKAISGESCAAPGSCATISGGLDNTAVSPYSTVSGGKLNKANYDYSTVSGGDGNTAGGGGGATIGGGYGNRASNMASTIAGGRYNTANGLYSTVSGGQYNTAHEGGSTIGGGFYNTAINSCSTIGGGRYNTAFALYATVPGGEYNRAHGWYSFAAGRRAKAIHTGAFVWADAEDADFGSSGENQFLIRASGGVGIGTSAPQRALHISDVLRLEPRDSAPGSPGEGDLYVNSTDHHIYCYLNGAWTQLDN